MQTTKAAVGNKFSVTYHLCTRRTAIILKRYGRKKILGYQTKTSFNDLNPYKPSVPFFGT